MSTTSERLREFWGERQLDRTGLASLVARYWYVALLVAIVGLAAGLRLWDLGERAVHHDESIHIKFAYDITKHGFAQYVHDPVYHGPLQYFGTAAMFKIFGDSDYTSRLFPALFGILLVGLPFLLRRQLGTLGTLVAASLLAVSPSILYFSRFARNDAYIAFFTLALVVCIWRYLEEARAPNEPPVTDEETESLSTAQDYVRLIWNPLAQRKNIWLVAIGPLLVLSYAAKEVTYLTAAVLLIGLDVMVATDLVDQLRASRRMSAVQTVLAYAAIVPTAWAIVAVWPLTDGLRKGLSWQEMPAAGALLIVFGTLAAPQFAAGIQALPFIEDQGYPAPEEQNLMRVTVLVLILGGAYVGLLWNWRVWLAAAVLFYVIFVVLFTSFFTHMGGFWTGIWGSMDYWLGQQDVRRGSQPDYYYFMTLPVYEFLPLIFALGGALYYAFKGKVEQQLLAASALLLVIVFALMPDDAPLVGKYNLQIAFVIPIVAVLLLSMDGFTKFLLFWTLSIFFALTVAGEKMPWLTVHIALPLILLAAKVLDDLLSPLGAREPDQDDEEEQREPGAWLKRLPPLAYGAVPALGATGLFLVFGPASGLSVIPWLLSLAAAGAVLWAVNTISWRAAGQVAAVALFGALLVFTVRASVIASFDQGDPGGTPPELLIYAQGSPGLGVIADGIDRLAAESGQGKDRKIVIDNGGGQNIWPWPWYLRHYTNVQYTSFEDGFIAEPGSVVLAREASRSVMAPYLDDFEEGQPYVHMWWFPEFYRNLKPTDFLGDVFSGHFFSTWRDYFIDRKVAGASAAPNMVAYFPTGSAPPPFQPPDTLFSRTLPEDELTVIGGPGPDAGELSQPADLAMDADGNLYVVDTLGQRVQKFAPDGSISTLGESGAGDGQFGNPRELIAQYDVDDGPWGIAVDGDGNIYVADTWNHRIQKFDANMEFVMEIVPAEGSFFGPRDVEIGPDGNLLIVDTGNNKIWEFDTEGRLAAERGKKGGGQSQFNEPSSLSVAPNGDIYIADYWNRRVQHFDSEFTYIGEFSVESWVSQGITDRAYIAAIEDGMVLATDPGNGRILVFDSSGEELTAWRLPTSLTRPVGILVDAQDQVYISDGSAGRVVRVPLAVLLAPEEPEVPGATGTSEVTEAGPTS